MAPKKRTTRSSPATTTTTTTHITDEQLKALIAQGVADVLAERDATRSRNGEDSHDSGPNTDLKKKTTDKYCPRGEIKKLKVEMWNLKVKGTDVIGYNQRFQELALMCVRMFPEESDKVEKYVGGLPDMIHGSTENKRKQDENNNQAQQQPPKKQGVAIAYTAETGERKESDSLELKNQNHRNQAGGTGARGIVHALRGKETNQDLNDIEDDINA
ncbi:hypothetical protein Tco_1511723 [Tanacetum coccineum]